MAEVFQTERSDLSDSYVDGLLARPGMWVIAATVAGEVVGGLTAHTLAMTTYEGSEMFLYDIAVLGDFHRRGVGRSLVDTLLAGARATGIETVFVPAEDDDVHALDFYRALGGVPAAVTMFDFDTAAGGHRTNGTGDARS